MAMYFVDGAAADDAASGTDWSIPKKTIAGALSVATTNGDIVVIKKSALSTTDSEVSADTTYTVTASISIISATATDGYRGFSPSPMGTSYWIGNNTSNRGIQFTINNSSTVHLYGLTFKISGTSGDSFVFPNSGTGSVLVIDSCYFWMANTSSSSGFQFGLVASQNENSVILKNNTFKFGHVSQGLLGTAADLKISNLIIDNTGTAPDYLFIGTSGATGKISIEASDLSACSGLVGNQTTGHKQYIFRQCKIPSTLVATQTTYNNLSQVEAFFYDCSSGDTHYNFIHNNGIGELSIAVGGSEPYITTSGAEYNIAGSKSVCKIVTTANTSFHAPYVTPWFSVYNEVTSAITPYFEALRKGSSTAYLESELWSEWMYKGTSNSTAATINTSDKGGDVIASGSDQATSSLTAGDWTNEDGASNVYHKLTPSSSITPTEIGDISGRVCVAAPSTTVYFDPVIRGLS
jgi:hypothetical protein